MSSSQTTVPLLSVPVHQAVVPNKNVQNNNVPWQLPPMPQPLAVFTRNTEDRPWELQWLWITVLVLLEAVTISGLVTIERISAKKNGIASVINVPTFSLDSLPNRTMVFDWSYSLLWTTIPTTIIGLVLAAWKTTVSATAKSQPYIELRANSVRDAKSVKMTLLLDYPSSLSSFVWIEAWKNHHLFLGLLFLFSLVASVSVPLSAGLFFTADSTISSLFQPPIHPSSTILPTRIRPV